MMDIPLAVYTKATRLAAGKQFLETGLTPYTIEQLQKMVAWTAEVDPNHEPFQILESDDAPMPSELQRKFGKIYLNALNAVRAACLNEIARKTASTTFGV